MSELQDLLERFAETGEPRGVDAVFDTAVKTAAHRRKQRRFRATVAGVVAVIVAVGAVAIVRNHSDTGLRVVTTPTSISPAPVTAALLIAGHWDSLPPAPISTRDSPSIAWTGTEMLVWGGFSGRKTQTPLADGAAYDPRSRTWRRLPAAPLTARFYAASAWTGTEMVIWGGYTNGDGSPSNDGAAYNPVTNGWRRLSAGPLRPQANVLAVWSGNRVVILSESSSRAAAYDPTTDRWEVLTPPKPVAGATPLWRGALRMDDQRLLLWAHADTTTQLGHNGVGIKGATTMFVYDDATNEWRTVPTAANAIPDIHDAFWTGSDVIVRGDLRDCEICSGPGPLPDITATYRPDNNTWSVLPSVPPVSGFIGGGGSVPVWTGAALWAFDPFDNSNGPLGPGRTIVYDPDAKRWTRLAAAPFGCANSVEPIWAGNQVLVYCPSGKAPGLAYVAAR